MTRRDTKAYPKLRRAALAGAVLVLLAAVPALAQLEIEPRPIAAASEKICEGKYKTRDGESIISVICPNLNSTCTCSSTGIDCGGTKKDAPSGSTFVEGSCKTTYTSTAAVEGEVLEALYRAIFEPEQ
jgi:hypothetical protein